MSECYQILIRADEAESQPLPRAELRQRLLSVPKLVALDEDHFEFGEADEHGIMTLLMRGPDPQRLSAIEVQIPRPWVMESGPQVFALVFMLQGWTDWEVYDPQIEGTLQREAVLQGLVAMRQARMREEGRQVPEPRFEGDPSGLAASEEGGPDPAYEPLSREEDSPPEDEPSAPPKRRWRFW